LSEFQPQAEHLQKKHFKCGYQSLLQKKFSKLEEGHSQAEAERKKLSQEAKEKEGFTTGSRESFLPVWKGGSGSRRRRRGMILKQKQKSFLYQEEEGEE
jgi:hypothetical protein